MNETEYKPNSHKSKESKPDPTPEKKHVGKVISGTAKVKKKNELGKIADIFISEDIKNVKNFVFMDVLVPAIKKAISDIVTDGIDMILYGGNGRRSKNSNVSKISYRSFYDKKDERPRASAEPRTYAAYSNTNLTFDYRQDAEEILNTMHETLEAYGIVSIADLYEYAGLDCEHTDYRYGWTDLRTADVERTRDGYTLSLPKAIPIK